jgi:MFS family permease
MPAATSGLINAIGLAFCIQTVISFLAAVVPVIAVEIAASRQLDVNAIALYLPLVYGVAFTMSFFVPSLLAQWGALPLGVACIACGALGEAALLGPDWRMMLLAPLLVGLAIGGMNPVTAQILSPHSSPRNASAITAIKQTGVPLGAAAAGLIGPILVRSVGWMTAISYIVIATSVIAVALLPVARRSGPRAKVKAAPVRPMKQIRELLALPGMVPVLLAAVTFVVAQFCLRSFFTVYLVHDLGHTLALAGLAFTVSQVAGIVGQLWWAMLAGRVMTHQGVLALIGILMAIASVLTGLAAQSWSPPAVLGVAALFGFTAAGFIPVVLGLVMGSSAVSEAGAMTSAANSLLIGSSLLGPLAFGGVANGFGYSTAFLALAALCLSGALLCVLGHAAEAPDLPMQRSKPG